MSFITLDTLGLLGSAPRKAPLCGKLSFNNGEAAPAKRSLETLHGVPGSLAFDKSGLTGVILTVCLSHKWHGARDYCSLSMSTMEFKILFESTDHCAITG